MTALIAALRQLNRRRSRLVSALVNTPVAFGLLTIALLAGGWNYLVAESSRDRVAEANALLFETEHLFSLIKDLDTGERGFVLVGSDNYLIPYDAARSAIDQSVATVHRLAQGDLRRGLTGEKPFEALVSEKRELAAEVVAVRKKDGFEAASEIVRAGEGKRIMDAIRLEAAAIRVSLQNRVETIQRSDRLRGGVLALLTGVASWSAAALLAGLMLKRREEARQTAALLEGVLDNAPLGLGFLDRTSTLRRMNPPLAGIGRFSSARDCPIWSAMPDWQSCLASPVDDALLRGVTTANVPVQDGARSLLVSVFPVKVTNDEGALDIEGVGLVVQGQRAHVPL